MTPADNFTVADADAGRSFNGTIDPDQRLHLAPNGTRAPSVHGGAWCKVEHGWKWNGPDGNGATFPRPGGGWSGRFVSPEQYKIELGELRRTAHDPR